MSAKSLIFLFLDGVGIGENDGQINPFRRLNSDWLPFFSPTPDNDGSRPYCLKAVDACLGVPGIPQSGSGQTTLFSGLSYPGFSGEHAGSFPTRSMRQWLFEHNLLKRLIAAGCPARFFNAYPFHAELFAAPNLQLSADGCLHFSSAFPSLFRRRISATTSMMLSTGQAVASEHDMLQEKALYQDFSNRSLIRRGADLPLLSPAQAGRILGRCGRDNPGLTLYEFFLSDQTGHRGRLDDAVSLLGDLAEFVAAVGSVLDADRHTLLICSDHGNIEDMSHPGHTRNPVPLWIWGRGRERLCAEVDTIADLSPAIIRYLLAKE